MSSKHCNQNKLQGKSMTRMISSVTMLGLRVFAHLALATPANNETQPFPPAPEHTVSWQAALWPLIALALNAMLQRSGADNFPSDDTLSPARTSVFICLADIFVALLWMIRGSAARQGLRETARLYRSDMGIFSGENILLKGTPAVGLILFVLVPLPQALKLIGSRGIPWTQAWMTIFLLAYVVSVAIDVFGVPHNERKTKEKPKVMLSRAERQRLVTLSDLTYTLAYLAQLGVWIWIAADLFESGFEGELRQSLSKSAASFSYILVIFVWFLLACYAFEAHKLAGVVLGVSWIVFVATVRRSAFIKLSIRTNSWLGSSRFARFLSFSICVLVALAFIAAGVAITLGINGLFSALGYEIAGPASPRKAEPTVTQEASPPQPPQPAHLPDRGRQTSAEIPEEGGAVPVPRVRRTKSLHFPETDVDHDGRTRRASLTLEANLPTGVDGAEAEAEPLGTSVEHVHQGAKKVTEQPLDRLYWQPDEHPLLHRMISIGFALTNLVLTALYYGYKYESAGTYRSLWTEQIG